MKRSLSFIASSILLATPVLAESIDEAFKNSKVKGEVKAAYVDSNFLGSAESDSVSALGGNLNLITGEFYNTKAGVTFQSSSILDKSLKNATTSDRTNYFYASGSVLSEAYLEYVQKETSVKIGKQFIYTPLVSTGLDGKSSESIIKDSFNGYILTNSSIENTTIVLGYVTSWQAQSDSSGNVGDFADVEDGAVTLYLKNTSAQNTTIQAQLLQVSGKTSSGDKDALYLQADYQLGKQTLSAQYISSTDKSKATTAQDGKAIGLKATGPLGISNLGYLVAYNSSMDDNGAVYAGAGEGTTETLFTAMPVHGGGVPAREDTDTLVGALVVPTPAATIIAYGGQSTSSTNALGDVTAYGAMAIAPLAKNLLLKVNYEHVEVEKVFTTHDTDTSKVYLTYSF